MLQKKDLWLIYVAGNNETYFGLYIKRRIILLDCKQIWILLDIFS